MVKPLPLSAWWVLLLALAAVVAFTLYTAVTQQVLSIGGMGLPNLAEVKGIDGKVLATVGLVGGSCADHWWSSLCGVRAFTAQMLALWLDWHGGAAQSCKGKRD